MQSETSNFEPQTEQETNNPNNPNTVGKKEKETGKWFSKAMFLQTMNTFSPIPIVYFALLFLAMPMDIFLWDIGDLDLTTGLYKELSNYANYGLRMGLPTAFLLGCLSAMMVFRYLCNNRSSNMVHSLPIKREALYVTQYIAGLSFVILPNIALLICTLMACAVHGIYYPEPFVIMFLVHCGLYTFFYSFAVLCAMLTGSVGSIFLYFLILNFVVAFVTLLVQPLLEIFYLGYIGSTFSYPFVRWLTPLYALTYGSAVRPVYQYTAEPMLPGGYFDPYPENISYVIGESSWLVGYGVVTVFFVVAGFFLYKARHIETAGEAVAAEWLKPVFRFSVGVIGGLAMGIVSTLFVITSYEDAIVSTILPIYSLGWCLIFVYLSEMIIQKSFRVFSAWKKSFLPLGTVALIFAWLIFDWSGFVHYIPPVEEIRSVEMVGLRSYPEDSASTVSGFPQQDGLIQAELGQAVTEIHENVILNAQDYLYRRQNSLSVEGEMQNVYFTYKLVGGDDLLERGYHILCDWEEAKTEGTLEEQMLTLVNDKSRQEYSYQLDELLGNVVNVQFINVYDQQNEEFDTRELSEIDRELSSFQLEMIEEELAQAVLRDFEAGNIGEKFLEKKDERYLEDYSSVQLMFTWEGPVEDYQVANVSNTEVKEVLLGSDGSSAQSGSTSVAISHKAKYTMEVLKKYNLTRRFQVLTNQEILDLCVSWFELYVETLDETYLKKMDATWLISVSGDRMEIGLDPMSYLYMLK